ncbi:RNA recognition motif domain [Arabidopsis thaliana x Arabidopsis arenosa]|uniref:Polyadenylate-binding protein n=1 Tax=Arabidopsis thaliana x Arabidopsis arenosa TaxID=1240361 RepID=A0A8T2C0A3_9BRAS|nr:RNA recognition motif domain [Arabidopsis thaliana x Arabidopsis arenosa]
MAAAVATGVAPATMVDQIPSPTAQTSVQVPVSIPAPSPAAVADQTHPNSSLYAGDLDPKVTEAHLFDLFKHVANVVSVRVCRDQNRRSLGYAYINFSNPNDAYRAMEALNYTPLFDRPIRIMLSNRDPSTRLSGKGNIFIKNLDASIDNKALFETFSSFGTILSCKVAMDVTGRSKGYGFVQFEKEESAQAAIDKLNGMLMNDKQVFVGHFIRRQERARDENTPTPHFTNVYVKNLPKEIGEDELRKTFGKFGVISSAVVMRDQSGNSRCFGFVNFECTEAAASAVEKMNGISLGDDVLYIGRAQKKSEREEELRRKFEQERINRFEKSQGANLYLKNLDDSVDDEKLKEMFSEYGNVTSSKVMLNPQGLSRGFGFVAYSNPEEALRALSEMNGKMIGRKQLYIALAQRKEDRRAHLQALFSQIRAPGPMSGFHHSPGGPMPGPPQHIYVGQNEASLVPSQPIGYGFQPQFMPGMRPGSGSGNFIMPYPLQRQPQTGPRMGFRRGATNIQQQQLMNRNPTPGMRYMNGTGNGRNGMDLSVPQGILPPIMPLPIDASSISHQKAPLLPISKLTSSLASASPADRTRMLGEQLYPLVERHEPLHVAKVTGMLLEMDQAEILHLMESPEALKSKVSEALDVLRLSVDPPDHELGFSTTD